MTAPLPPLPELVRNTIARELPGNYDIIVMWMQDYARLAVREALERAAQKYAGQRLVDGSRVSEELRAMIEEYK